MANKKKQKDMIARAEVESFVNDLIANNTGISSSQAGLRMSAFISGGYDFADTMHNVYLDYGYPAQLRFNNFWNMYRRFGVAKSVIELPVDMTWVTTPTFSEETASTFIGEFEKLEKRTKFWKKCKALDTRKRVGRYAGMFMRVADGKQPHEPLEGVVASEASLVDMTPLYESQLEVIDTVQDTTSVDYGKPITYQYSQGVVGNRNEEARTNFIIHASRVVPAAEGADDGSIYGLPVLECIYNSLMDLRKIIGGGAEGMYKNAAQSLVFKLNADAPSQLRPEQLTKFTEQLDDFTQNRSRRHLLTPNVDVDALASSLVSPQPMFDIALADVAAGSGIASTVIIGKQTGERASTEDSRQLLSQINSRRENDTTMMVSSLLDWCQEWGVLPSEEYELVWDDLLALSDEDRLKNASVMSVINKAAFDGGSDKVFDEIEIRQAAGFEKPLLTDFDSEEEPEDAEAQQS